MYSPTPNKKGREVGPAWFQESPARRRSSGRRPSSSHATMESLKQSLPGRVHFSPKVRVKRTLSRDEYTREETEKCYYSRADLQRIYGRVRKIVDKLSAGMAEKNLCTRGLEKYHGARKQFCTEIRMKTIDAVLDEQEAQWEAGEDDPIRIAAASLFVTHEAVRQGIQTGKMDLIAVKRIQRKASTSPSRGGSDTSSHSESPSCSDELGTTPTNRVTPPVQTCGEEVGKAFATNVSSSFQSPFSVHLLGGPELSH